MVMHSGGQCSRLVAMLIFELHIRRCKLDVRLPWSLIHMLIGVSECENVPISAAKAELDTQT